MGQKMTYEQKVMDALMDRRVSLLSGEAWDHEDKIDFVVTRVEDTTPRWRIQVQLTKQGGNLHKLDQFLAKSADHPNAIRIYLVPAYWHSPRETARAAKRILRFVIGRQLPPGTYGFFIEETPCWKRFDPAQRVGYLRRRTDPSNPKRLVGYVVSIGDERFMIETRDGSAHLAYVGDADGQLAIRLKDGRAETGMRVTFVPHVQDHGPAVGALRALSVILAR